MGHLERGRWVTDEWKRDEEGRFVRSETSFRNWVRADGSTGFTPDPGRYHLYVSLACPWAHRTLIARSLKGLREVIGVSIVDPFMGEDGWRFSEAPDAIPDTLLGKKFLREVYTEADPHYTGRVTVPVLWDKKRHTICNNESREILRMLDHEFNAIAENPDLDLAPPELVKRVDATIDEIYGPINNGVYRCGFATTQKAYDEAVEELFTALGRQESLLAGRRYLCGNRLTEADICMFTTLVRFDPVYHYHFKCNIRRIRDFPNLWNYLKDVYQTPGVAETVNLQHIRIHYYTSHEKVNPTRIVPAGPLIDYTEPHDRERFGA